MFRKNKDPELNDTDNSDITKSTNTALATQLSFNDFSDIVGAETLENIHDEVETQKNFLLCTDYLKN